MATSGNSEANMLVKNDIYQVFKCLMFCLDTRTYDEETLLRRKQGSEDHSPGAPGAAQSEWLLESGSTPVDLDFTTT